MEILYNFRTREALNLLRIDDLNIKIEILNVTLIT